MTRMDWGVSMRGDACGNAAASESTGHTGATAIHEDPGGSDR